MFQDSSFFTIILHCVLAYSLPPIDYLALKPGSYDSVSSIPQIGILQTPPYYGIVTETVLSGTPTFVDKPSWLIGPTFDNAGMVDKGEVKNSQSPSYNPELPDTVFKVSDLKYPLTTPRVKLGFIGNSGVLPVKTTQNPQANTLELLNKVFKPTGTDLSTRPGENGRVAFYKNIQAPSAKLVMKPAKFDYPSINPGKLDRQDKLPLNTYQFIPSLPSSKPGRPHIVLYPTDFGYPPTNPRIDYGKYEEALKAIQYTQTYKPDLMEIEALKPTNDNKPPTNPGVYYGEDDLLEKAIPYTPSYKAYVPTIPASRTVYYSTKECQELPVDTIQQTPLYKNGLPLGVLKLTNLDYPNKQDVSKDENTVTIELPPVPTTMSLSRRTQLALMNTVAGLPGGNPQVLDSVRAR